MAVCKLKKAIYGLKQSPRAWYAKLSSVLMTNGLKISGADPSLFVKSTLGTIIILVCVDDIVMTSDDHYGITALKELLHNRFAIEDLGILKYFLGL